MNIPFDIDASRQLWHKDADEAVVEVPFDVEAPEDYDLQIDRLIFAVEDMASQLYRTRLLECETELHRSRHLRSNPRTPES